MFRTRGTCEHDVGAPFMPLNAFATHRPSVKAWHGRKPIPYLPMASGIQTCYRRVCGSTTGHWGSGNAALTVSCRRCRTMPYTSSDISRFPTMLLFPRPFGSRSGGRLGVICLELRPPQEAIPSVRDMAHAFIAHGSREKDVYRKCLFRQLHGVHRGQLARSLTTFVLFSRSFPSGPSPCMELSYMRTTMLHLTACRASESSLGSLPSYSPSSFTSLAGSPVFPMEDSNKTR